MSTPMPLEESYKDWKAEALLVLDLVAGTGVEFDAYTLQDKHSLRQPPNPQSHWGALFRAASNRGLIEKAGYGCSQRPTRSKGSCHIWRGLPSGKAPQ